MFNPAECNETWKKEKRKLINSADVSINDASILINLFVFFMSLLRAEMDERQFYAKFWNSPISIDETSVAIKIHPSRENPFKFQILLN